jgi:hypothetical protein
MIHTIADASADKAGQREHAVKYTVCRIRERNILSPTSTEIRHGTEHSWSGETKRIESDIGHVRYDNRR